MPLSRFEREAQVLAALNHSHIATIYGLEDVPTPAGEPAKRALIMELVDGPTLAERLVAGPLPVGEALAVAQQIAGALAAAHDVGVVHRDLKPANVKVTLSGAVKVLDFGLAKLVEPGSASSGGALSIAPTTPFAFTYSARWRRIRLPASRASATSGWRCQGPSTRQRARRHARPRVCCGLSQPSLSSVRSSA